VFYLKKYHPHSPSAQVFGSDAGWSSLVARRAHNPKVVGSNPAPATNLIADNMSVFLCLKFSIQAKGRRFTLHKNRAAPATNLIADNMSVFLYLKFGIQAKGRRFTLYKNRAAPAAKLNADMMSAILFLELIILEKSLAQQI
jgi:hypothetical protein